MINFQKDHTTPEQSKRLLELGVPADSANCFFVSSKQGELSQPHMLYGLLYSKRVPYGYEKIYLPCWTALRLMEIIDICVLGENSDPNTEEYPTTIKVMNKLHIPYVEYLVKSIERAVQLGTIDFSKLEG